MPIQEALVETRAGTYNAHEKNYVLLIAISYPILFILRCTCSFSLGNIVLIFTKTVGKGKANLESIVFAVNGKVNIIKLCISFKFLQVERISDA